MELSIVMPCLNEAETLAVCIRKSINYLQENKIHGEVVIADNGSTDGSQDIAIQNGARVVDVVQKGYGSALRGGIEASKGKYVIMGDSDDSYDFSSLGNFVTKLRQGYDLVMGNRFKGGIMKGAMPFLHKYLGNPVLSFIGKVFFKIPVGDFHCGLRGFSKEAYYEMNLNTTGMEFASEMVVKSSLKKLRITEVPTVLSPAGRTRAPHLNTWRDGWRHLRFLLLFSPKWLFLIPGAFLFIFFSLLSSILFFSHIKLGGIILDINTLLFSNLFSMAGLNMIYFYIFSSTYAIKREILPENKFIIWFRKKITLEKGLFIGSFFVLFSFFAFLTGFFQWSKVDFGNLIPSQSIRISLLSFFMAFIGIETIVFSFLLSYLEIPTKK